MNVRERVLPRAVAYRLFGLAILILSLVGMHHLMASQCHHATSVSAIGHASNQAHEVPISTYGEPLLERESWTGLLASQLPGTPPASMVICLAMLIALLGNLRPADPLGPANRRRTRSLALWKGPGRWSQQPSLHMMSTSRT